MKKVEAIIRHFKLEDVKQALTRARHYGHDRHRGPRLRPPEGPYRDLPWQEYKVDFVTKIKVEVVVPDDKLQIVLETIMRAAKTGQVGDGKMFVSDLSDVIRIRTGESGEDAL